VRHGLESRDVAGGEDERIEADGNDLHHDVARGDDAKPARLAVGIGDYDELAVADRLGAVTGVSSSVNSQETARMDYQQALKNPGKMFRMPEDLEASAEFDAAQKRAILLQWKDQLMQLQRATNENMPGPESDGAGAECLRRVVDALIRIDGASARKP
jgi:hypothetical protein